MEIKFDKVSYAYTDNATYIKTILSNIDVNIEDKDGYRYNVEISSVANSNKLLKFYETNPHTIYNIKKYIDDNNINVELLSDTFLIVTVSFNTSPF